MVYSFYYITEWYKNKKKINYYLKNKLKRKQNLFLIAFII